MFILLWGHLWLTLCVGEDHLQRRWELGQNPDWNSTFFSSFFQTKFLAFYFWQLLQSVRKHHEETNKWNIVSTSLLTDARSSKYGPCPPAVHVGFFPKKHVFCCWPSHPYKLHSGNFMIIKPRFVILMLKSKGGKKQFHKLYSLQLLFWILERLSKPWLNI